MMYYGGSLGKLDLVIHPNRDRQGKIAVAVALLAIVLAAFWGGAYVSETVFDRMPHVEDEHAFLFQAKTLASGKLFVATPPYPEFFPTQFVVDNNGKRFGKYPPGYPAILSLGVLAGQPHLVNPLLGALTLVLVFLVGRELYDTRIGLVAASLGLVSPFFLMMSGSYMSHSTTLFFFGLFVLFFLRARRSNSIALPLLAGASLGMAFITRQLTAAGLALPFVVYGLMDLRSDRRSILRYSLMSLAFAAFAGFLLYYNRLVTGDPFLNPYELWWSFDKIGFGPWETIDKTLEARWIGTLINLQSLSDYLFGWPARLSLVFVVMNFVLITRNRWDWLLFATALSLMVAYMTYWTSGEMYGPRYFYESLPMLLILTARGMAKSEHAITWLLLKVAPGRGATHKTAIGWHPAPHIEQVDGTNPGLASNTSSTIAKREAIGAFTIAVLVSILIISGFKSYLSQQMTFFNDWYDVTSEPLSAAKRANLHNALVFVNGDRSWTEFASLDVANSPNYDTDVVFAADHGPYNGKLARLYPGRNYYRMVGQQIDPYVPPP